MDLLELMKTRKSVRTFDGKPLREEDLTALRRFAEEIGTPFGIPVRFVFLDAKQHGLSSPVLVGDTFYAAGICPGVPEAELAYAFAFEKLVLFAWSLGIGTVWIAGTMDRAKFEKAAGLEEGERMPCITPLGYPAEKRSMRETFMRKSIGADNRMKAGELFFEGDFSTPVSRETEERFGELMEMVRWAPSAVNKQPWRVLVRGGDWHFYEKQDSGFVHEPTGDLQKIDVGIALCHLVMGAEERKIPAQVRIQDPESKDARGWKYTATVSLG